MERISHYRLVARLGKGAMGEVWRAVDERLGRPVALKLLPVARSSEQKMQARLLREAQAASALNHPGIVTVHDVGSWHGQIFMVMELVDGEPLSELARRGIPPAEALRLVADAAEALAAAHAREILHRDIKTAEVVEIELATGAFRAVYKAGLDGIDEATYAPDGDGLIASVVLWNGDLWLADGTFR